MESAVGKLFERYERLFRQALAGEADMDEVASLYASDFIAASPAGVLSGRNGEEFKQMLAQGYEHYRAIGTLDMMVRHVHLSPVDERHCMAHVAWTAIYAHQKQPDTKIDFEVHYLVQILDGEAKVFGWISGDEQALLKQHGIG